MEPNLLESIQTGSCPSKSKKDVIALNIEEYNKAIISNSFLILPVLFEKMDFATLKTSRAVCVKWYRESLPQFRKRGRSVLTLDAVFDGMKESNYPSWKKGVGILDEDYCYVVENLEIINTENFQTRRFLSHWFALIEENLNSLTLSFSSKEVSDFNARTFALILVNCTRLKYLHLINSPSDIRINFSQLLKELLRHSDLEKDFRPLSNIQKFKISETLFEIHEAYFFGIPKWTSWMPKLECFELGVDIQDELQGFSVLHDCLEGLFLSRNRQFLENITKFSYNESIVPFGSNSLANLYTLEMKLTVLEIGSIGWDKENEDDSEETSGFVVTYEVFRNLLHQYKDSLKILRISSQYHPPSEVRLKFDRLSEIDFVMGKLKILEIDWDPVSTFQMSNFFTNMPALEVCKFNYHSLGVRQVKYSNRVELSSWSPETNEKKNISLECKSPQVFSDVILILMENPAFSNVRVMSLNLVGNKHHALFSILTEIPKMDNNLEKLYIWIGCNIEDDDLCCKSDEKDTELENNKEFIYSWLPQYECIDPGKPEINERVDCYKNLRIFELTSVGCRKIHMDFLRREGILRKFKLSPVLEIVTLKYKLLFNF